MVQVRDLKPFLLALAVEYVGAGAELQVFGDLKPFLLALFLEYVGARAKQSCTFYSDGFLTVVIPFLRPCYSSH